MELSFSKFLAEEEQKQAGYIDTLSQLLDRKKKDLKGDLEKMPLIPAQVSSNGVQFGLTPATLKFGPGKGADITFTPNDSSKVYINGRRKFGYNKKQRGHLANDEEVAKYLTQGQTGAAGAAPASSPMGGSL